MIFESDKFVLTNGGVYVGKGYLVYDLFKANVVVVDKKSAQLYPKLINKGKTSIYMLESTILWACKLQVIAKLVGYISKLNLKEIRKCEIYVEVKFAKKLFH